jgi:hypothetical protein
MTVVPLRFTALTLDVSKYLSSSEERLTDTTCNAVILGTLLAVNVLPEVHKVSDVKVADLICGLLGEAQVTSTRVLTRT